MNVNKKKELFVQILLVTGIILFVLAVININFFHYNSHIDSDIAGEGLVARASWVHKSLRPKEWYLGPESRIFYLTTFVALIYGMTGSMTLSMAIGCTLAMLIMLAAISYVLKTVDISKTGILFGMLAFMAIPINLKYLELTYLYAAYYSVNLIVMLFALGFYLKLMLKKAHMKKAGFAVHIVCAFLLGCSGMRGLLNIYAPLIIIEALRILVEWRKGRLKHFEREDWKPAFFCLITATASFLGTLTPFGVDMGISKSIRAIPVRFIHEVIPSLAEVFGLFGWQPEMWVLYVLLILFIVISIIMAVYVIFHLDGRNGIHFLLAFLWAAPLLAIFMETVTTVGVSFRYPFVLVIMVGISITLLFDYYWIGRKKATAWIIFTLFLVFSVLNYTHTYIPLMKEGKNGEEQQRIQITEWMEAEGYFYGYATFDDANKFTMQADGAVQVSALDDIVKLTPCKWVSDVTWYTPYVSEDEKIVFIIKKKRYEEFQAVLEKYPDIKQEFETEKYMIFSSQKNYIKEPES